MDIFTKNLIEKPIEWLTTHGVSIILIFVIGFATYHIGSWLIKRLIKAVIFSAKRTVWSQKDIKKRQDTVNSMFMTIWKLLIGFFIVVSVSREAFPNVNFSTFIASLGAISVMISLGAQSLIKDFLNGIFIVSENQYRVGDVVDIDGYTGTVTYVGTRVTILRDLDGNVHYFSNGSISHVINKTMTYSISRLKIGISPDADLDKAIDLINKIGKQLADKPEWKNKIIKAPHFDSISSIDGKAIELVIVGKTQPSDQWVVSSKIRQMIIEEFIKNEITLA